MEQLSLTIPALWADHHVTNVKRLLSPLTGVENVIASAAFKEVFVEYDPTKTTQAALVQALTNAGYAPGELELVDVMQYAKADPAWDGLGMRTTTTNQVDLQLSGEFRKY